MDIDTDGAGGDATRRLLGDYQTPARCAHIIYTDVLLVSKGIFHRASCAFRQGSWFDVWTSAASVSSVSLMCALHGMCQLTACICLQICDAHAHAPRCVGGRPGQGHDGGAEPKPPAAGADAAAGRREPADSRLRLQRRHPQELYRLHTTPAGCRGHSPAWRHASADWSDTCPSHSRYSPKCPDHIEVPSHGLSASGQGWCCSEGFELDMEVQED